MTSIRRWLDRSGVWELDDDSGSQSKVAYDLPPNQGSNNPPSQFSPGKSGTMSNWTWNCSPIQASVSTYDQGWDIPSSAYFGTETGPNLFGACTVTTGSTSTTEEVLLTTNVEVQNNAWPFDRDTSKMMHPIPEPDDSSWDTISAPWARFQPPISAMPAENLATVGANINAESMPQEPLATTSNDSRAL